MGRVILHGAAVVLAASSALGQRCAGGEAESTSIADPWKVKGLYASYYPTEEFRGDRPWNWPPGYADLRLSRLEASPSFQLDENVFPDTKDFGLVGEDLKAKKDVMINQRVVTWKGRLNVPCTGEYTFYSTNDDGVVVILNDEFVIEDWNVHTPKNYTGKTVTLKAGTLLKLEIEYFQSDGTSELQLYWDPPGPTKIELIPSKYFVPSLGPAIIATPSALKLSPEVGAQELCVRLSQRPTAPVTVKIQNDVGFDLFGFSKCMLDFTVDNWETPQCIQAAANPLAISGRAVDGITPVFLNATSEQVGYNVHAVVLAVDPATTSSPPAFCSVWGDPHISSYDNQYFNFYHAGLYTVTRDCSGDLDIQSHFAPCWEGAEYSCATHVYLKLKDSLFLVRINLDSPSDLKPIAGIVTGSGDGVVYTTGGENEVIFKSSMAQVSVKVEIFDNWRSINMAITASGSLKGKLVGLCGNFNNEAADDEGDQDILAPQWLVPDAESLVGGRVDVISALDESKCGVDVPDETIAKPVDFEIDTCSEELPPEPLPSVDPGTPPATPTDYVPAEPGKECDDSIKAPCLELINADECPALSAEQLSNYQNACIEDSCAMGKAIDPANPPANLLDPLKNACEFVTPNPCSRCRSTQACIKGTCTDVLDPCGNGCLNEGWCMDNGVCECSFTDGYWGQFCEFPAETLDPCESNPCPKGTECKSTSSTDYTCEVLEITPALCFSTTESFKWVVENIGPEGLESAKALHMFNATAPDDGGYCLQIQSPDRRHYFYNCNHEQSELMLNYYPDNSTVKIEGDIVRCMSNMDSETCAQYINAEGPCQLSFEYPVSVVDSTVLAATNPASTGGGTVTCKEEITTYVGKQNSDEQSFKISSKAGSKGEYGIGWLVFRPDMTKFGDFNFRANCTADW